MSYVKVETSVPRHPKFLKAGPAASWLWLCGLAYCQDGLTDGFISDEALTTLGVSKPLPLAATLVGVRLWHKEEGGYRIHGYLEHNNSAEYIRRVQHERRQAGRRGGRGRRAEDHQVVNQFALVLLQQPVEQSAKQTVNPSVSVSTAVSVPDQKKQERADAPTLPVEIQRGVLRFESLVRGHKRRRSRETHDGKPAQRVITALARSVVRQHPEERDEGELTELLKRACATHNLLYDTHTVALALEQALARARKVPA